MLSVTKKTVLWSGIQHFSLYGLPLILTLLVSRLISPDDYGIVAYTVVFFSITQAFIDFGLESSLIQKKDISALDLNTAFIFTTSLGIVAYIVFLLAAPYIATYFNVPVLEQVVRVSAIILLLRAASIVPYAKLQRELNFKAIARITFFVTLTSGGLTIFLLYKGLAYWALIIQSLFTASVMLILYVCIANWKFSFTFSAVSLKKLLSYGMPLMFTSVINAVYGSLYSLFIGKKFGEKQLGLYNRSSSLGGYVPTNISDFTLRALFPIFSKHQDDKAFLRQQAIRTMHFTAFIVVPVNFFLMANASDLIQIILKDKWIGMTPLIRVLCLAHLSYIVCNVHVNILKTVSRTKSLFACELIKKLLGILSILITVPMGMLPMIWGFLICSFLNVVVGTLFTRPAVGLTFYEQIKSVFPILAIAAIAVGGAFYMASFIENIYARLLVSGIVSAALYLAGCLIIKDESLPFFMKYIRYR